MQTSEEFDDFVAQNFPPFKGLSPHAIAAENDREGLRALHKFGWLRAREIGNVLWANNPTRHIAGARIARRWLKSGLVMARTLPYGHGPVYVLTKAGADFLIHEFGIEAASGKKIGDHIKGQTTDCWRPTLSWQHDLIANSFLSLCLGTGYRVATELEISRKFPNAPKIPDGLYEYVHDDGTTEWIAIEIERANKYSSDLRRLIQSIHQAQLRGGIEFGAILVKRIHFVYHDPLLSDSYGERPPDHFSRLKRALEGSLRPGETVQLVGLPVLLKGGAVIQINEPIVNTVGYSLEKMITQLARPEEWFIRDSQIIGAWPYGEKHPPYELKIKEIAGTKNWDILIVGEFDDDVTEDVSHVSNVTEHGAKEAAIRALSKLKKFQKWVKDTHVHVVKYANSVDEL